MKSPITGKEMLLRKETRQLPFRKEDFSVIYHFYFCEDSGEKFTTTELDELNLQQLYNLYRDKHNIPFPEEIIELRNRYGISAKKMSDVLGLGVNSYRNYENGEVPNHSNSKLIRIASDPRSFKEIVQYSDILSTKVKDELLKKAEKLIKWEKENSFKLHFENYLMNGTLPNEFTGFKRSSLEKLTEMVVYFTQELCPWKTAMNKLLFYADFGNYKQSCHSISGVRYRAITWGPVPDKFNSLFDYIVSTGAVDMKYVEFPSGAQGEQFQLNKERNFNDSIFNRKELEILEKVVKRFEQADTKEIVDSSHNEKAWFDNEASKKLISYQYAFDLIEL